MIASRAENERPERERVPRNLPSNKEIETTMQITECPERERVPRNLPGADLVASGIEALRRGELTVEALLVAVGARRLRDTGLEVPAPPELPDCRSCSCTPPWARRAPVRRALALQRSDPPSGQLRARA